MNKIFFQILFFSCAGILGGLVNLVVLYIFTDIFNVFYLTSAIISFFVASITAFFINKKLTFNENLGFKIFKRGLRFFIVNIMALIVNIGLLYFITEYFNLYYLFSQAIALVIASAVNFTGHRLWTFK